MTKSWPDGRTMALVVPLVLLLALIAYAFFRGSSCCSSLETQTQLIMVKRSWIEGRSGHIRLVADAGQVYHVPDQVLWANLREGEAHCVTVEPHVRRDWRGRLLGIERMDIVGFADSDTCLN